MVTMCGHIFTFSNGVLTYPREDGSDVSLFCMFSVIGHAYDGSRIYGISNEILFGLNYFDHTSKHITLKPFLDKKFIRRKINHSFYFVLAPNTLY